MPRFAGGPAQVLLHQGSPALFRPPAGRCGVYVDCTSSGELVSFLVQELPRHHLVLANKKPVTAALVRRQHRSTEARGYSPHQFGDRLL